LLAPASVCASRQRARSGSRSRPGELRVRPILAAGWATAPRLFDCLVLCPRYFPLYDRQPQSHERSSPPHKQGQFAKGPEGWLGPGKRCFIGAGMPPRSYSRRLGRLLGRAGVGICGEFLPPRRRAFMRQPTFAGESLLSPCVNQKAASSNPLCGSKRLSAASSPCSGRERCRSEGPGGVRSHR